MTASTVCYNLQGTVRHQGLAVVGMVVCIFDAKPGIFADSLDSLMDTELDKQRTDSSGSFNFSVPAGVYTLDIQPGHSTRFLRQSRKVVVSGGNSTINVILSTGVILTGSVRTRYGTNAPLSDGEIVALGIEPSSYRIYSPLRRDDQYSVVVPKGKYHVAFRCPNGSNSKAFIATEVAVVDVGGDGDYDLVLSDFIRLKGEVQDTAGKPAQDACITLVPAVDQTNDRLLARELGLRASCYSDENGQFQIDLQRGAYDLTIEPDKRSLLFTLRERNVRISESTTRKFQLADALKLHGQVVYEDSVLPNCLVRVQGIDRKVDLMARTDAEGQFSVSVPAGNYKLIVTANSKESPTVEVDGSAFPALAPWTKVVVVGGDTRVSVRLQKGTLIQGRVTDVAGVARPGVEMTLLGGSSTGDEEDQQTNALAGGATDSEGRFCFFACAGSYRLAIHSDLAGAHAFEVGDQPVNLDVVWQGWCQTAWQIIGHDNKGIPRCRVSYKPYADRGQQSELDSRPSTSSSGLALSDENGQCHITLPAGIYVLEFEPPPGSSYDAKTIKQLSINSDLSKSIELPLKVESAID